MAVVVLVVAVVAAFAGSLSNGFVDWDDNANLIRNEAYQGLSAKHLWWMFTTGFAGHYHPLTWLSHAIDYALWGAVDPFGAHLTNLLLHLVTTLVFFALARRLIALAKPRAEAGAVLAGALAAAMVYAIHPLRVESVAWATERRDVLSGALLTATLLLYLRATVGEPAGRNRRLALCLACFVLSLMSKAWGMTLPVVLLVLDVYPLRRIGPWADGIKRHSLRRVLIEKGLFVIPAIATGVLAVWAQSSAGAMRTLGEHPLSLRIAQACYGIVFYLAKTIWPYPLYPLYEKPRGVDATDAVYLLCALVVLALTAMFFLMRRRRPALPAVWIVYIVVLSPVLGIAQSGPQIAADRYTYLAAMPWCVLLGAGVAWMCRGGESKSQRRRRVTIAIVGLSLCAALLLRTRDQVDVWRDSETLWTYVLRHAPDTGLAHSNYAVLLNNRGDSQSARAHAERAIEVYSANPTAHSALARACFELGLYEEAERGYLLALELDPDKTNRMISLAMVYTKQERFTDAERLYREVIALEPEDAEHRFNLGGLLASRARWDEAGVLFDEAIGLDPEYIDAYFRAGVVRRERNDWAGAAGIWREGLTRSPRENQISAALSYLLATCPVAKMRDGADALRLARIAVEDSHGRNLRAREALAAALARTGGFEAAIETAQAVLDATDPAAHDKMRERIERALTVYRDGEPFTDGPGDSKGDR